MESALVVQVQSASMPCSTEGEGGTRLPSVVPHEAGLPVHEWRLADSQEQAA